MRHPEDSAANAGEPIPSPATFCKTLSFRRDSAGWLKSVLNPWFPPLNSQRWISPISSQVSIKAEELYWIMVKLPISQLSPLQLISWAATLLTTAAPFTQTFSWMLPPPPLAVGLQTYPTSLKPPNPSPADYSTPPHPFHSPTKLLLPAVEAAVMIVCERWRRDLWQSREIGSTRWPSKR